MVQEWSRIIAASVVPVVIISACGLLCLAFYNRLAAIVSRLRSFQRERLKEQEALARYHAGDVVDTITETRHQQMLELLEAQTRGVTVRARLIRRTLQCLLGTIACLTVCSATLGLSIVWTQAIFIAMPMFILGLALLLAAVTFAMRELGSALEPVEAESRSIADLVSELESQGVATA